MGKKDFKVLKKDGVLRKTKMPIRRGISFLKMPHHLQMTDST
jgi:hypothetical protein